MDCIVKKFKTLTIFFTILFILSNQLFADDIDYEEYGNSSLFVETSSDINEKDEPNAPSINSRAAIVYDRSSGMVLFGKNENEQRKMASTTKIMTCIVVLESSTLESLNTIVTVSSKSAGTGGSRLGLHTNDKVSVMNLLYGLMLCSGNDAAVALAEHVGGSVEGFAELMNKKASDLGLTSTHFVTPHGLDNDEHYTTAYELAIITNYALKNETFRTIVGTKSKTIAINNSSKTLTNTNELLGYLNGVYGVKTGFTNGANRCLVTAINRNGFDIICIVLGADTKKDRTQDSIKLIEYVFNNFSLFNLKEKITSEFENWKLCNYNSFEISKGISNNVELCLENLKYDFLPLTSNQIQNLNIYIYCDYKFNAPLEENHILGYLNVYIDNQNILTLNIYNSNFIDKKNSTDFFIELLKKYIYYLESIFFYD